MKAIHDELPEKFNGEQGYCNVYNFHFISHYVGTVVLLDTKVPTIMLWCRLLCINWVESIKHTHQNDGKVRYSKLYVYVYGNVYISYNIVFIEPVGVG